MAFLAHISVKPKINALKIAVIKTADRYFGVVNCQTHERDMLLSHFQELERLYCVGRCVEMPKYEKKICALR